MRATVSDRIDEAVEFARESDYPGSETAFEGVYTEEI
jgi:TPP-dependent pyruvate/acetoin dehydrogenase alpha subunit